MVFCQNGMHEKAIRVTKLKKAFGEKQVLTDFSAVFKAGEVTTVMGSSGCGKTTLLNLLMGFLEPDSGTITNVPNRKSAVFQEDRLCESFHAVTNIRMVIGKEADCGQIEEHLKELGLPEDSFYKPVAELSGGMKRRVAIARAVLFHGDILFMDEPFKGLDAATKQMAVSYIKKHTKGKTIIMVTHDQTEAVQMGGSLIMMKENV